LNANEPQRRKPEIVGSNPTGSAKATLNQIVGDGE